MAEVIVGETYKFSALYAKEHLLCGKVVELLDGDRTARVELTEPATTLYPLMGIREGAPVPIPKGETLTVWLSLVTAKKA